MGEDLHHNLFIYFRNDYQAGEYDTCLHCHDSAFIVFDEPKFNTYAEPCPMCSLGKYRSIAYARGIQNQHPQHARPNPIMTNRDGKSITESNYYKYVNLIGLSWMNNLTINHTYKCATIGCKAAPTTKPNTKCKYCVSDSNRIKRFSASDWKQILIKKEGSDDEVFE